MTEANSQQKNEEVSVMVQQQNTSATKECCGTQEESTPKTQGVVADAPKNGKKGNGVFERVLNFFKNLSKKDDAAKPAKNTMRKSKSSKQTSNLKSEASTKPQDPQPETQEPQAAVQVQAEQAPEEPAPTEQQTDVQAEAKEPAAPVEPAVPAVEPTPEQSSQEPRPSVESDAAQQTEPLAQVESAEQKHEQEKEAEPSSDHHSAEQEGKQTPPHQDCQIIEQGECTEETKGATDQVEEQQLQAQQAIKTD